MKPSADAEKGVVPRLRFPEFADAEGWGTRTLGTLAEPVTEKVGSRAAVPFTITSGQGLISQEEKLGRTIAGKSLKNYYRLQRDDFAFNKSATKLFPEGYIARLHSDEAAAVPNSIFTCFRVTATDVDVDLLDFLFQGNLHGDWLRNFITVGARANGALQISDSDLYAIPVPLPRGDRSLAEQRKIAACLGSLNAWLAAEGRKLAALARHKRGLLQQLFPREGQTRPHLRFPEFRDAGEWEWTRLDAIADLRSGSTPSRSNDAFYSGGTIPWVKTGDLNNGLIRTTEEKITPAAGGHLHPKGAVLIAMYGGFKQIGRTGLLDVAAATNQALSVLVVRDGRLSGSFVQAWMNANVGLWKKIAGSSRKDPNVTGSDVGAFPIAIAEAEEQTRIAACLSTLDARLAAQAERIHALRTHKRGLMQQLFPAPA